MRNYSPFKPKLLSSTGEPPVPLFPATLRKSGPEKKKVIEDFLPD
jgi:hypothetical protein